MNNVNEMIHEADCVLIGIGEEFQENFNNKIIEDIVSEKDKASFSYNETERVSSNPFLFYQYLQEKKDGEKIEAYQKLSEILKNKNYFIVSTCNDDLIFHTSLNPEKIVTPCGNYQFLQCPDNCNNELIKSGEVVQFFLQSGKLARCPHCKKELIFNHATSSNYNEKGYIDQWEKYTNWLQHTLNKKLIVMELGVGMKYPTVIRWPFEKIVFFNQKSFLIRVHSTLSQISEEIVERALPISENSIDFVKKLTLFS